ncbi:MAG: transposase, partial [Chloroflexota bacterium]|nr:transposase [Chloroflexota bacterium]
LQQLAQDPRFLGGQIGMLGVLQTWTRDLRYHPHIHYLVPAIGLAPDGSWMQAKRGFLVHVKPLAILFRAKFQAAVRQTPHLAEVAPETWRQAWVVDCRAVGSGRSALHYLAPYIFRVALSNNRIVGLTNDELIFRYTDGETGQPRRCTLPPEEFMRRFLQHVLPKGFVKVRYYGLFSPGNRRLLAQLRHLLALAAGAASARQVPDRTPPIRPGQRLDVCSRCGQPLVIVPLLPNRCRGPPCPMERAAVGLSHV